MTTTLLNARQISNIGLTKISTTTLVSPQSLVSFTSIPATYTSLLVLFQCRTDQVTSFSATSLRFNNDSGANYDYGEIAQSGTTLVTGQVAAANASVFAVCPGTGVGVGIPASGSLWVPNYAGTTFDKVFTAQNYFPNGTDGRCYTINGIWKSTSAINRVDLIPSGTNFLTGTFFALYGAG